MSRAFVKEADGNESEGELPERPISPHRNFVTPRGMRLLHESVTAIDQALTEIPDTDLDAKPRREALLRDRRYFQARIETAEVITHDGKTPRTAAIGAAVTVSDENDKQATYVIVGEDEAEPEAGRISWVSPLARALEGAEVGDAVTWQRPAGDLELEVTALAWAKDEG